MAILTRSECAKYSDVIVMAIFANRVHAYVVTKIPKGISLLASVVENREEGGTNEENIRFNCQKVLQALSDEHKTINKPIVFMLDPSLSHCSFISVDAKRQRKDSPISDVELNAITNKYYGKEEESQLVFRNFPIDYLVDDFKVPQPLFLNGENITSQMVTVSFPKELENVFSEIASTHTLQYAGVVNMCQLFSDTSLFAPSHDNILISIFQDSTTVTLMRNKICNNIGKVAMGYGILIAEVANAFSIGLHEASAVLHLWQNKKTDENANTIIDELVRKNELVLKEKIQTTLASLDSNQILPASLYIVQLGLFTQPGKNISTTADWLKDLPIARNVELHFVESDQYGTLNASSTSSEKEQEFKNDALLLFALLQ